MWGAGGEGTEGSYVGKLWTVGGRAVGGGGCFMRPPQEVQYSVCTCTVCLGRSHLCQSLFDSVMIMDFNSIVTCLGVTFLY